MYTLLQLFPIFMVEKRDFLKVVKVPELKNGFLAILRSFFSTYKFFPGRECCFRVCTFKKKYFNESMSSLAGLKKKLFSFLQKYQFWPFLTAWVQIQGRFSQRTGKISENPRSVSWRRVSETLC